MPESPERTPPPHFLILSRGCLHLYEDLVALLRERPEIRVVTDRRYHQRRQRAAESDPERRRADRRRGSDMVLVKGAAEPPAR